MNSRERVLAALRCEEPDRVPVFSSKVFREPVLPRYRRVAEKVTIPWILHSCGIILPRTARPGSGAGSPASPAAPAPPASPVSPLATAPPAQPA